MAIDLLQFAFHFKEALATKRLAATHLFSLWKKLPSPLVGRFDKITGEVRLELDYLK